ncbi:MAG: hypothetical protein AB7S75_05095 [Desulfococcaceae bacterium]
MGDDNKNGADEPDSIRGKILILSVAIVVMLLYLLFIMQCRKTETKEETKSATVSSEKIPDNPAETGIEKETKSATGSSVSHPYNPAETEKETESKNSKNIADIISKITDIAAMYSQEDTSLVTKKLGELLDELADAITRNKIQDTKKVMKDLGEMTDKIMECINIQRDKMADSEKSYLTRKTENLKESLKLYLMEDAYPVAEKLNILISFINDNPEPAIIGKIKQLTDFAEIYSRKDVAPVTKKLGELINDLAQAIKTREVKNTEAVMDYLEKMTDKITDYIEIQGSRISDSDRKDLTDKAEELKAGLKPYPMKEAYPVAQKLNNIIMLLAKNKAGGKKTEPVKTETAKTEPPKTEPPKTEPPKTEPPKTEPPKTETPKTEPPKTEPPKTEPPKTEPPKTEPPKTETVKEEISPAFAIPDNLLTSQELNALSMMENNAVSSKTICKNRQNTVHFLSPQLLVRLVDIYPPDEPNSPGRAVIDVTHPRLGLRRFSEMEEGTTRPFEYGSRVFFLELLKIHPHCADVAVYERKNS